MCPCSAVSIFLFASSKLLPRTVIDSSSQTPFQPSSSSQKLQSVGMFADTFSFTAWVVIEGPPSWALGWRKALLFNNAILAPGGKSTYIKEKCPNPRFGISTDYFSLDVLREQIVF
jgi:hypothetical protein